MRFLFVLLLMLMSIPAGADSLAAAHASDIEKMLDLAQRSKLGQSEEWHKINLYHAAWSGIKSRVDDPTYFLSPEGAHDPQAELDASIRAAFDVSMTADGGQPNLCRRIARYQFLSRSMQALGFAYAAPHCEGFERWKAGIATDRATLVFASVYLNSPASMYGHAFIRFDGGAPGEYRRLNDATVGYFVQGSDGNGAMFLLRSLLGGYPGSFGFVPYYVKMREYSDLENRDLWEYQTALHPDEIDHMLAFIWEQSFTYMNYYFFDDNCALMLLAAFEAARPSLDLIEQAKPWYIPLDMLKLVRQAGLIEHVHYRPSQYNTLMRNQALATEAESAQAHTLMEASPVSFAASVDETTQARILDLSLGMLEYRRNQKHSGAEVAAITARQIELSGVRSKIGVVSDYKEQEPPAQGPEEGHGSFRAGIIAGQVGASKYAQINLRGAYHDSLDPQSGFAPGASSKIGDLYLRLQGEQIHFERLDFFDVFAPAVQTVWEKPVTLKINISLRREVLQDGGLAQSAFRTQLGAGKTYSVGSDARAYILADSVASLGDTSTVVVGPTAGVVWALMPRLRSELVSSTYWTVPGDRQDHLAYKLSAGLAWDTHDNQNNLRLNVSRQGAGSGSDFGSFTDVQLGYFHYF